MADELKIPGVIVLSFAFDEGDESPFGELLDRVRESLGTRLDVAIYAGLGSSAQDINDLTRHW